MRSLTVKPVFLNVGRGTYSGGYYKIAIWIKYHYTNDLKKRPFPRNVDFFGNMGKT